MSKQHYALKLIPKRPTFPQDITPEEREIMNQHLTYWTDFMNKGHVIVFGPVMDPKGVYGFGVIEAGSEEQVRAFMANDPATTLLDYEHYPMQAVVKE